MRVVELRLFLDDFTQGFSGSGKASEAYFLRGIPSKDIGLHGQECGPEISGWASRLARPVSP
jgi:hypothetical protein